jgi:hypothetical protein
VIVDFCILPPPTDADSSGGGGGAGGKVMLDAQALAFLLTSQVQSEANKKSSATPSLKSTN